MRKAGKMGPWFHVHCASLGEFEQGAEVLAALRRRQPNRPILLTFFSPSGVEGVSAEEADHIDYLPFDLPQAMNRFARTLDIGDTVLVKYELWPGLIQALHRKGCRIHLIASRFDPHRHPLNRLGFLVRKSMRLLSSIQTQDSASGQALEAWNLDSLETGDPRVDRVHRISTAPPPVEVQSSLDAIAQWAGGRSIFVVGSAWPPEWSAVEAILEGHSGWCALVAPHEIHSQQAQSWAEQTGAVRLSQWTGPKGNTGTSDAVMIADRMGILKYAYRLGAFAVVGGGWGKGVHNTLEAAVYGLPVLFGPAIAGFREIDALLEAGAARVCHEPETLIVQARNWMAQSGERDEAGKAAARWLKGQSGAAERIADALFAVPSGGNQTA